MPRLGQPFDRLDLGALRFGGQDNAAIYRHAIHDDRASAAVPVVAAFLRASQPQRVAQRLEQALPRLTEEFGWFAVDSGGDMEFFRHGRE